MRRFTCDTANWHVFARGSRRLQLFRDEADFTRFLNCLVYALKKSGCILWAFALMTNHYHLVLRGSSAQLTACMRRLNTMYSRYHNRRYSMDGHAFDGPYKAFRQPTPLLMLHTIAYVFFNPVKGGLCARPEDYPWSCCRSYLGLPGSPLGVDAGKLMASVDPDLKKVWTKFSQAMEQQARKPAKPTIGRPTMIDLHQEQFEWLLEQAKEQAERLAPEEPVMVAMYWASLIGVSPRAMAKVLGKSGSGYTRVKLCKYTKQVESDPTLKEKLALR